MTIANMINVPITGKTGTGNIVLSTSPSFTTPTIGAATATSINFGQSTISNYTSWTSYTPTLTLVGGSGNTVPTYTGGDTGRYVRIGNIVYVIVEKFNTTGGTAGAGTGQINIALPVQAGTNVGTLKQLVGYFANSNAIVEGIVYGTLASGTSTITLVYFNAIGTTTALTGVLQNQTLRQIGLHFWYEV